MAKNNSPQMEPSSDEIELEVATALTRISTETSTRKLYGTAKSPGVFIGEKELQVRAAKFCIDEQLIQEAGTMGKGKSAHAGYIITEKGLKHIKSARKQATERKWKAIDQQVTLLVDEHNETFQLNFLDKTKKIEELKTRYQADLKKLMAEQAQRFDRLIQQVRNTLMHDFQEQAHLAVKQLMETQSGEIDRLIDHMRVAQSKLLEERHQASD